MIQIGFLFLLCIAAVTDGAPAPAPAPKPNINCINNVVAASNFNATLFQGIWYELTKFFPSPGREGKCGAVKYTDNRDGTLKVDLGWVDKQNVIQKRTGTLKHTTPKSTDAQFIVTLENKSLVYTIFYLAYQRYFGVYACLDGKADVWVFGRDRKVTDVEMQGTVYKVMQTKYPTLNTQLLVPTILEGCKAVV